MFIEIISPINATNESRAVIDNFIKLLAANGIEYSVGNAQRAQSADFIAVFGGDGTVLSAALRACEIDAPILAINTGTIGFLSGVEKEELSLAVNAIKRGEYALTERTMLSVRVGEDNYTALNDAVIERDKYVFGSSVISKLKLSIDGADVYSLRSDGVIIATPTGSTAYSLSAGGVVLTPQLDAFIATPICSHSLTAKPIVYPDDKTAVVTVLENSSPCLLCIDGRCVKSLSSGDAVIVGKDKKTLKIVDIKKNFFDKIRNRLGV